MSPVIRRPSSSGAIAAMRRSMSALLLLPLVCIGCANGFKEYYQGDKFRLVTSCTVVTSQPPDTRRIGTASFVSAAREGERHALSAAKSVGADYVMWAKEYQTTTSSSGVIPNTVPTTTTTYHSGNIYGGWDSYSYSGTSTTYGSETHYIPYTKIYHWFKYTAEFFRSYSLDQIAGEEEPVIEHSATRSEPDALE